MCLVWAKPRPTKDQRKCWKNRAADFSRPSVFSAVTGEHHDLHALTGIFLHAQRPPWNKLPFARHSESLGPPRSSTIPTRQDRSSSGAPSSPGA